MSHLHSDSVPCILGQANVISHGYGMRSRVIIIGPYPLILPSCPLFMISVTKFNSPHRPGEGLESSALNLLQTSCILHFA